MNISCIERRVDGQIFRGIMGAERLVMPENLPVERLVRKALRAGEPFGRPGIHQLGVPQGAKRLEERLSSVVLCSEAEQNPLQRLVNHFYSQIVL